MRLQEANQQLLNDYKAFNALSNTIGQVAAGRKLTFTGEGNDLQLSQQVNQYRTTLGSVVRISHDPNNPANDEYVLFNDYADEMRADGKSAREILDSWGSLADKMRQQERNMRLNV